MHKLKRMGGWVEKLLSRNTLILFLVVLIILNLCLGILLVITWKENGMLKTEVNRENGYELLSPAVAWVGVDEFVKNQNSYTITYVELKPLITQPLDNVTGEYGVYIEDMTTGAWLGINEKEKYVPASLLKVPIMVSILKKVEREELGLDNTVTLRQEDLDLRSGSLGRKGAGYEISIRDLLKIMIKESDNTAVLTLGRLISEEEYTQARLAMGLPLPSPTDAISPKEYSNIFRSLYFSSYLRRPFSQLGLSIMLETDFNSQIPAGVPADVKVSHKVGFYKEGGYFHDCGIVYYPQKPYLICIMSKNSTQEESDRVMSEISKIVYDYTATHSKS